MSPHERSGLLPRLHRQPRPVLRRQLRGVPCVGQLRTAVGVQVAPAVGRGFELRPQHRGLRHGSQHAEPTAGVVFVAHVHQDETDRGRGPGISRTVPPGTVTRARPHDAARPIGVAVPSHPGGQRRSSRADRSQPQPMTCGARGRGRYRHHRATSRPVSRRRGPGQPRGPRPGVRGQTPPGTLVLVPLRARRKKQRFPRPTGAPSGRIRGGVHRSRSGIWRFEGAALELPAGDGSAVRAALTGRARPQGERPA
jgi:hypothetical protein